MGGYYADSDILFHKLGILNMYVKKRYYDEKLYQNVDLPNFYILNNLFFVQNSELNNSMTKAVLANHYRDIKFISIENIQKKNNLNISKIKQVVKNYYYNNIKIVFSLIFILSSLLLITIILLIKRRKVKCK